MEEKENTANYSTGYIFYRMKSAKPNRGLIAVPEEYDRKANYFMEQIRTAESPRENANGYEKLRAIAEDVIYINMCMDLAKDDIKNNEGEKKQDAINKNEFFRKILESLI